MNTLKANAAMISARECRRVKDYLGLIRGRVEVHAGLTYLQPKLAHAERLLVGLRSAEARDVLEAIDRTVQDHERSLADAEMAAAGQRQEQLLDAAGIDTAHTASGIPTRHGFRWLEVKGRLTPRRRDAGQRYGADYSLVRTDSLKSCLNDNVRGAGEPPQVNKSEAQSNLTRVSMVIEEATGSGDLVALLDAVCGRGETVRQLAGGDKNGAAVIEARLMVALDMAATAYGIAFRGAKVTGWREA